MTKRIIVSKTRSRIKKLKHNYIIFDVRLSLTTNSNYIQIKISLVLWLNQF